MKGEATLETPPRTHWLLRVSGAEALRGDADAPEWVNESLKRAPWVVVRRAPGQDGLIPVGVRGEPGKREQRYAAWVSEAEVLEWVSPQMLVAKLCRGGPAVGKAAIVAETMDGFGLGECWGPGGSVGFELASGARATTAASDLDLIIEKKALTQELAKQIWQRLPDGVDVLLETAEGGIVLADYANNSTYVLRTKEGPRLHGCISVSGTGPTNSRVSGQTG